MFWVETQSCTSDLPSHEAKNGRSPVCTHDVIHLYRWKLYLYKFCKRVYKFCKHWERVPFLLVNTPECRCTIQFPLDTIKPTYYYCLKCSRAYAVTAVHLTYRQNNPCTFSATFKVKPSRLNPVRRKCICLHFSFKVFVVIIFKYHVCTVKRLIRLTLRFWADAIV